METILRKALVAGLAIGALYLVVFAIRALNSRYFGLGSRLIYSCIVFLVALSER